MNEIQLAAMADELEKIAGISSFIGKGITALRLAPKMSLKSHGTALSNLWKRGVEGHEGNLKRLWEGAKSIAKSPYGNAAGTATLGGLAAYGGYKATIGRDGQRRR
jgi:hypothetical protein